MTQLLFTIRGKIDEQDGESQKYIGGLIVSDVFHKYETWSIIGHLCYLKCALSDAENVMTIFHLS